MSFKNELPEWQAQGTEPPQSLKEHGWQAGIKPPADYFNWLQYKAYKSLQELQQYAIHKDEKGKPNGVATLNDEGKVPSEQIDIDIDTSDLAKKQDFENLKFDYMYQIPTIVDAQIRINRLSDTNRLFFKLEDDLTGDITISTDGGMTEKPLVDVEENQIESLEKGFVEVVADANFFILRNRGISQADKQALIDIVNEAEANESDLKGLFVDEINTVDEGDINLPTNATWADILAVVPNIKTGKKWASGKVTVNSNGRMIVSNLSFNPSIILWWNNVYTGSYIKSHPSPNYISYASMNVNSSGTSRAYAKTDSTIQLGSFDIRIDGFNGSEFNWIAFE